MISYNKILYGKIFSTTNLSKSYLKRDKYWKKFLEVFLHGMNVSRIHRPKFHVGITQEPAIFRRTKYTKYFKTLKTKHQHSVTV